MRRIFLVLLLLIPTAHGETQSPAVSALTHQSSLGAALDLLSSHYSDEDIQFLGSRLIDGGRNLDQPFAFDQSVLKFQESPLQVTVRGYVLRLKSEESIRTTIERFEQILSGKKYGWFDFLVPRVFAQKKQEAYHDEAGAATLLLIYATQYNTNSDFKKAADLEPRLVEPLFKQVKETVTHKVRDVVCLGTQQKFEGLKVVFADGATVTFEKKEKDEHVQIKVSGVKPKVQSKTKMTSEDLPVAKPAFDMAYPQYEQFCKLDPVTRRNVADEFQKLMSRTSTAPAAGR